ncbi:MAG: hypothetical protein LBR29_10110, partial [Methylobacteriaceae bacterium]|nr:hypothetical protein [Methylobacteriaceae bacterium]
RDEPPIVAFPDKTLQIGLRCRHESLTQRPFHADFRHGRSLEAWISRTGKPEIRTVARKRP